MGVHEEKKRTKLGKNNKSILTFYLSNDENKQKFWSRETQWYFYYYFTWGSLQLMTTALVTSNVLISTDLYTN